MGVLFIHSTKRWSQHTRHCSSAGIISNKKHAPPLFSLTSSSNGRDRELLSAVTTWHDVLCLVTLLCLTLCSPMDCNLPGTSVHGILQARIMEWAAMPSSRGSSQPRDLYTSKSILYTSKPIQNLKDFKKAKYTPLNITMMVNL